MKYLIIIVSIACIYLSYGCSNTENSTTTIHSTSDETDKVVNATDIPVVTDTTVSSDNIHNDIDDSEVSTELPDGMVYQRDDGSYISVDDIMNPMNTLNSICMGTLDHTYFKQIYPEIVIDMLNKHNGFDSSEEYSAFLHDSYSYIYGENYTCNNQYDSSRILNDEELNKLREYYLENYNVTILPQQAFIVHSVFSVTYTDNNGNEKNETESDIFISYSIDDQFYLDYFYVNTLDL